MFFFCDSKMISNQKKANTHKEREGDRDTHTKYPKYT